MNDSVDRLLVEEILLEAVELPPGDRPGLLDRRCGADVALRREVESLLGSLDDPDGLSALDDASALTPGHPERIGDYRIVRRLGEGGMGVVLLAVREGHGFEQTVALKLLRSSVPDPLLARRLEEERRILARLEHPGIARLVDGGVTSEGQPYYAMEYVPGEHLLAYCDGRRSTVRERIELFIEVCDAIHYAHQQLVVHRDLKPSNILVGEEGRPKLLDFGIAKNLEHVAEPERTARWLTSAYASPEQVTGRPVSTLSDVYALGVLLCELLAGRRPYDTSTSSLEELARVIGHDAPTRPSELVTAESRLARTLRGDLDLIVLKALAKEPERRYGSAWALREDLRRFLEGRPVEARPDSLTYRASRFVARHRPLVGAVGLAVVAVAVGTSAALWQARRAAAQRDVAEAEAQRARQVTALMTEIFRLGDPTEALGDTVGVRQVLSEGTRRVETGLAGDPPLQATLLYELARVYRNLGILSEAERLGERALTLRQRNQNGSLAHAEALGFQGLVLRDAGRAPEAIDHLERAIEMREALLAEPDTVLATLLAELAWAVRARGEPARAAELFERSLAVQRRELGPTHPLVATGLLGLAATFHDRGRFEDSEQLFREALGPGPVEPSPVAAGALVNLGMVRRLREEYREAEPLLRAGLEMRMALYDREHPEVLEAREQLGLGLIALGRFGEAEPLLASTLETSARVLGEDHERTRGAREALASLDHELGRFETAAARLDSVIAAKRRAHRGDHPGIVFTLNSVGEVLLDSGETELARSRFEAALAMGARLGGNDGVYGALSRHGQARAAFLDGFYAEADSLSGMALRMAAANLRDGHRYLLEIHRGRAAVLLARGSAAEAAALLEGVLAAELRTRPRPHPRIGATLTLVGQARAASGDRIGAREAWLDARAEFVALPPEHPARRRLEAALAGALEGAR